MHIMILVKSLLFLGSAIRIVPRLFFPQPLAERTVIIDHHLKPNSPAVPTHLFEYGLQI